MSAEIMHQIKKNLHQLATLMTQKKIRLATAESCTGGGVAAAITELAGSSKWFERGFVTYSNEAKQEMLGVSEQTLATFGAVSEQTAAQMAGGALKNSHADMAISVTGIAGPGGGSAEKPVGMVCFGLALARANASAQVPTNAQAPDSVPAPSDVAEATLEQMMTKVSEQQIAQDNPVYNDLSNANGTVQIHVSTEIFSGDRSDVRLKSVHFVSELMLGAMRHF